MFKKINVDFRYINQENVIIESKTNKPSTLHPNIHLYS